MLPGGAVLHAADRCGSRSDRRPEGSFQARPPTHTVGHLRVLAKGSFMATQLDHSASACFSLSGSFDDAVRAHPNRLWKHHVLRQLLHARLHLDAAGPFFN